MVLISREESCFFKSQQLRSSNHEIGTQSVNFLPNTSREQETNPEMPPREILPKIVVMPPMPRVRTEEENKREMLLNQAGDINGRSAGEAHRHAVGGKLQRLVRHTLELHMKYVRETDDRFPNNTIKPGGSANQKLQQHFLDTYDASFSVLQRKLLECKADDGVLNDGVLTAIEALVDEKLTAVKRLLEITNCGWSLSQSSYEALLMRERAKLMIFVLRPVDTSILQH